MQKDYEPLVWGLNLASHRPFIWVLSGATKLDSRALHRYPHRGRLEHFRMCLTYSDNNP